MRALLVPFTPLLLTFGLAAQGLDVVPPGLQPGEQYRILFLTDGARDATSTDIADYDAFVTAEAESSPPMAALQTRWRAVAGTPGLSASEHTETVPGSPGANVPIYRPDGVRVETGSRQLWLARSSNPLLSSPAVTQTGVLTTGVVVWTGTNPTGILAGAIALGRDRPTAGTSGSRSYPWCYGGTPTNNRSNRLYGISDVLTVPVPDQQPRDLQPGDSYRLMFVSRRTTLSTSAVDLATLDATATAEASAVPGLAALATTWQAVVSDPSIDARERVDAVPTTADPGEPLYRTDGQATRWRCARIRSHRRSAGRGSRWSTTRPSNRATTSTRCSSGCSRPTWSCPNSAPRWSTRCSRPS